LGTCLPRAIFASSAAFGGGVDMLRIGHEGRSCTGFRMPAVGELDACCWPASESRQGTDPRSGLHSAL
jgi:hypothetical protein